MLTQSLPSNEDTLRHRRVVSLHAAAPSIRRTSSRNLLEGSRELVIEHDGNEYHLRLTRNDKLILTK
jgi:hemin uptake protein HemP